MEEPPYGFLTTETSVASIVHSALRDALPPSARAGLQTVTVPLSADPTLTFSGNLVEHAFMRPPVNVSPEPVVEWSKGATKILSESTELCSAAVYGTVQEEPDITLVLIGWKDLAVRACNSVV